MVIAFSFLQIIACLAIIVVVLFQSGKSSGLSRTVGGGNGSTFAKAKNESNDAKLARCTKWVALAFAVLSLTLSLI